MRRALIAVAVFLTLTASPAFAGYIIIRVLIEGGAGGPTDSTDPESELGQLPSFFPSGVTLPGQSGPLSGLGGKPAQPGMTPPQSNPNRSIVVVIPLESDLIPERLDRSKVANEQTNPVYRKFSTHHYGRKLTPTLFVDSVSIQLYEDLVDKPERKKTTTTLLHEKYMAWHKTKSDPRALYDALILALRAGVIRELTRPTSGTPTIDAMTIAQELLDVAAAKKLPLPTNAQRFVQAWGQMHEAVTTPTLQRGIADNWKHRLDAKAVRVSGHYAIVYWDSLESEVTRRAIQLNDNFAAFFLSHATRGIVLPVPTKPLVAVLASEGKDMRGLRQALDGLPMHTSAFYAPEHELLVLSPERLDNIAQTFLRQNHQVFLKGLSREPLLTGEIPKLDYTGEKGSKPDDVARATTLALVEKFFMDEADIAAVSAEGSRQLLFETGRLPKHVTLPNWLTSGAVSYFSRPRGPAYVTIGDDDKPFMAVSIRNGYDVPNYVHQRYFRDLEYHKELNSDRVKLLENVLTDAYFAGVKNGDDPDPAPPKKKKPAKNPGVGMSPIGKEPEEPGRGPGVPGGVIPPTDMEDPIVQLRMKRERLTIKAQATAWALYYYLANEKPELLKEYLSELNKFPRDLPIDGRTAFNTFVRVFDLATKKGGPADSTRLESFANDWLAYLSSDPPAWYDIPIVVPEPPKDGTGTPMPKGGGPDRGP